MSNVEAIGGIIDMRWAWIQELRDKNKIKVAKVATDDNKADLLTKCMPAYKFYMKMRALRGDQEQRQITQFVQEMRAKHEE